MKKRIALLTALAVLTSLTPVHAETAETPAETEEMQENNEELPEEEITEEEIPEENGETAEEPEETIPEENAGETGEDAEEPAEESGEPAAEEYVDPLNAVTGDSAGVFVRSLYNVILKRDEDTEGMRTWTNALSRGMTAADVIVSFVMSKEFQTHFPDNRTFVTMMYQSILGRNGAEKEITSWTNRLNSGISYGVIMQGFIGSQEFGRRCSAIGIQPGRYVSNLMADRYPDVSKFVANLYLTILERGCDAPGLENWIRALVGGLPGATAVRGFIESKEFMSRFPDPKTYAAILYRTALSREGSAKEIADWAAFMEDGQSYKILLQGFLNSAEFSRKCAAIGLSAGKFYSDRAVDVNRDLTKMIMNAHRKMAGADCDADELETKVSALLKKSTTAADVITEWKDGDALAALAKSPEACVKAMYELLLGRTASDAETASWASRMKNGQTFRIVLQGLIGSAEFRRRCSAMKVEPGSYVSDRYADKNYNVTSFVNGLYKTFLGRSGDAGGIENRTKSLLTDGTAADVLKIILGSPEYKNKFPGNRGFVESLFIGLLGHAGTEAQIQSWLTSMEEGLGTGDVIRMFIDSSEFKDVCRELGIKAGTYASNLGSSISGVVTIPAPDGSGRTIQVLYDSDGVMVKNDCKMYGYYFHIDSETGEITKMTKLYMEGYDLSQWNGDIDLKQFEGSFLILRISWSDTADERCEEYIRQCEQYGIPYGLYCYSYALSEASAAEEADFVLQRIAEIKKNVGALNNLKLGIWFDMEDADAWKKRQTNGAFFHKELVTGICDTFCKKIRNAGYYAGIYASYSWWWFGSMDLIGSEVSSYGRWIAHWGNGDGTMQIDLQGMGHLHQYTCTPLDRDVMYVDPSHFSR
ncbi:MAG: DUF4214 domain-containing protein [Solobacterium sp.]|nr:DUF4214 domain-containing protein [Solobacterium sp.]